MPEKDGDERKKIDDDRAQRRELDNRRSDCEAKLARLQGLLRRMRLIVGDGPGKSASGGGSTQSGDDSSDAQ